MDDVRHDMNVTIGPPYTGDPSPYINVFFPDLGNMVITYETRIGSGGEARPVISVDFDVDMIDVIDKHGGDREID